jgi:diacylglycerol O-acyltransferase
VFTEEADPVRRLVETARSCREGVELRRAAGLDMTGRWAPYTCRLTAAFLRHGGRFLPRVNSHVVTANVRGPDHHRWAGPLEITDWISFAVVANPSNINVTAHSYAGRMSVGLLVGQGVLPDPRRFLDRMAAELDVLEAALRLDVGVPAGPAGPGDFTARG